MKRPYTDLNKDNFSTDKISSDQIKTTDVNVLLNRVKLDKKKNFKKNILLSFLYVGLICSITIFFVI